MVLYILMVIFTIILYMVLLELWIQYIVKRPVDDDRLYWAAMTAMAEHLNESEE